MHSLRKKFVCKEVYLVVGEWCGTKVWFKIESRIYTFVAISDSLRLFIQNWLMSSLFLRLHTYFYLQSSWLSCLKNRNKRQKTKADRRLSTDAKVPRRPASQNRRTSVAYCFISGLLPFSKWYQIPQGFVKVSLHEKYVACGCLGSGSHPDWWKGIVLDNFWDDSRSHSGRQGRCPYFSCRILRSGCRNGLVFHRYLNSTRSKSPRRWQRRGCYWATAMYHDRRVVEVDTQVLSAEGSLNLSRKYLALSKISITNTSTFRNWAYAMF